MKLQYALIVATGLLGGASLFTTGCKSCSSCDMMSHDKKTASVKPYPLTTCLVSGEKLGEMGKPVVFVHNGQEIKLCCKDCQPKFAAEPAKYLSKLAGPAEADHSAHH